MLDFYVDGLGLIISDQSGKMPSRLPAEEQASLSPNEKLLHFTRFGSDHHQLVLISQKVWDWVGQANGSAGASINQITWQVGSLAEVVNGDAWISEQGQHLLRAGRDMPGSNWHTYLFDPEGHIERALLRHGADRLGRPEQAAPDVVGRPSRAARSAAASGGHRDRRRAARRYRHCLGPSARRRRTRRLTRSTGS